MSGLILLGLLLFPPWEQGAEGETDYRKYLGRSFFLKPPQPVPVDCYFVGCKTAPASYFHVLLATRLYVEPSLTVATVALLLLVVFHLRPNAPHAVLVSPTARIAFCTLVALVLPIPAGPQVVLLGTGVAYVPWLIAAGGENVLGAIATLVIFALYICAVNVIVTVGLWLAKRRQLT
jgi:hypothetical protein